MPTATYIPLATLTLTGNDSQIDFANIPNTYRDLILIVSATQTATGANGGFIRLNGDSASNYSYVMMTGDGSSASSTANSGNRFIDSMVFANTRTAHVIQIMDYSATDKHKTILNRINTVDWGTRAYAGRWASTNAVNSITLGLESSQSFTSGSTFSLYGIAG